MFSIYISILFAMIGTINVYADGKGSVVAKAKGRVVRIGDHTSSAQIRQDLELKLRKRIGPWSNMESTRPGPGGLVRHLEDFPINWKDPFVASGLREAAAHQSRRSVDWVVAQIGPIHDLIYLRNALNLSPESIHFSSSTATESGAKLSITNPAGVLIYIPVSTLGVRPGISEVDFRNLDRSRLTGEIDSKINDKLWILKESLDRFKEKGLPLKHIGDYIIPARFRNRSGNLKNNVSNNLGASQ
ncbi:MAG: hypothetical protein ABL958_10755 [Bdellovibrionia bacterium]